MQVQAKDLEEEDKGNCVGDMKAEDRHLLDTTGLPFFFFLKLPMDRGRREGTEDRKGNLE